MIKAATIPLKSINKLHLTEPLSQIAEIRLRAGRQAVSVNVFGEMKICSPPFSAEEIAECFAEICRYSVYSFETEIAQGFITLDGGHRVGICGTAVTKNGQITSIKDISGLNIRIAHRIVGCADELYKRVFSDGLHSLLLAGRPLSGKTTILRELARLLGERRRVVLIDSRGELSASVRGTPTFDIGLNTDALCGCEKSAGIMLAIRSLSPEVVICDEIGDDEAAVEQAMFCGVKVIASAHADSIEQLKKRPSTRGLVPLFERVAVIGERGRMLELQSNG
ncbi:MAG: Flp pilus assembly complex ATPase component TadA [Oscillospiraceae bacterium]|nr:Flp pilus assembly complex ATPase component TadA [Oscillospiraceae bacterium]